MHKISITLKLYSPQKLITHCKTLALKFSKSDNLTASFSDGIFYDNHCNSAILDGLNHAVLVVGYGSNRLGDYWIVKNSWSKYWGEDGYVRMARNYGNMCGIASAASYPTV